MVVHRFLVPTCILLLLAGCQQAVEQPAADSAAPAASSAPVDRLMASDGVPKKTPGRSAPAATAKRPPARPKYRAVLLKDVPHVAQRADFCGEACVEMILKKLGKTYDQDFVFDRSGLSPLAGRGCYTQELAVALRAIGFRPGSIWSKVRADHLDEDMDAQFVSLHADLLRGVPSIVCMHYDDQPKTTEHFRLLLGYDPTTDEVLYHEPAEARGAYRRMKRTTLLKLWPLHYDRNLSTVIRLRMEPGRLIEVKAAAGYTDADYAQHIMQLKKRLPHKNFTLLIEKPFVVVGDGTPQEVRRRSENTIRWAVSKLKQDYFKKDPLHLIDIWLFKDKESYDKHTKAIWKEEPGTRFGYYSSRHRALVMNISTGGGTLVHEIVHPFIESNFPDCPSWFNEGLASLYEQCGARLLAILTGGSRGSRRRSPRMPCRRSMNYAARRPESSTTTTAGRIMLRQDISATIFRNADYCVRIITPLYATPMRIRPATRRCKRL
jgi:hypothetical protein